MRVLDRLNVRLGQRATLAAREHNVATKSALDRRRVLEPQLHERAPRARVELVALLVETFLGGRSIKERRATISDLVRVGDKGCARGAKTVRDVLNVPADKGLQILEFRLLSL